MTEIVQMTERIQDRLAASGLYETISRASALNSLSIIGSRFGYLVAGQVANFIYLGLKGRREFHKINLKIWMQTPFHIGEEHGMPVGSCENENAPSSADKPEEIEFSEAGRILGSGSLPTTGLP